MHKRWVVDSPKELGKIDALAEAIGVGSTMATLLVNRGIENFEEAKCFFRPSLAYLHDPFLMEGMAKAVERLREALWVKEEKVVIYGDYDVDGTTAVAMVYGFLHALPGAQIAYYIPDRMTEGYGVSLQSIEKAAQAGITLIVTLDCGIKDIASITKAVALGIDVIVCDHHEVGTTLPPAYAILNPKQPHCNYPFKELSGCGIGFKLLQAFCQANGIALQKAYDYLDLVALSTACDLVPLTGENRILAYHGIQQLQTQPTKGLQALFGLVPPCPNLTIADLVFKIGPRINAAGRMHHATLAVELLTEKDPAKAKDLAYKIDQHNLLRKEIDHTITQEALTTIATDPTQPFKKGTVLFNPDWHKGIIGIVASRCIEHYYKPTIVLTLSNGKVVGSARSIAGYNILQAITACKDLLHQHGGHAFAAGLTMAIENVTAFQEKFEAIVQQTITDGLLVARQSIHAAIEFKSIDQKFVNVLMQMEPFGIGNPTPVFVSSPVYLRNYSILKGLHLKLELYQPNCHTSYKAIGFGLAAYEKLISTGAPFAIAYTIQYNYYLGHRSIQLMVKDIKAAL
ncbi:MAG: single-stranded-DNA-specific exonuclease RecJ [Amoebophilaceae bacterium]|nr:single-stranded-DNA-specific exonuclease RecJ [Amoebophilaceae bacterium]